MKQRTEEARQGRAVIESLEDRTMFSNAESSLVTSVAHMFPGAVGIATTTEIGNVGGRVMAEGVVARAHTPAP